MSERTITDIGSVEITEGPHAGTSIQVFLAEDGEPVVQIDTPKDADTHDVIRVHLNDSTATYWDA